MPADPGFRQRRPPDGGFVLPLALFGALVLLLSSLSLQSLALQSRSNEGVGRLRRQREDALFSAAQLLVGRLQQHRCLLALPLSDWTRPSPAAEQCSTAGERQALLEGALPAPDGAAGRFSLVDVAPAHRMDAAAAAPTDGLEGVDLTLQWRPSGGGREQRRFRLRLEPAADPLQAPLVRGLVQS